VPLMADWAFPERRPGELFVAVAIVLRLRFSVRCLIERIHTEKSTALSQSLLPVAVAEEAVIANAVEPVREHMQQESADELISGKRHGAVLSVVAIVLVAELHFATFDIKQAIIGDGNAVRITPHIVEYLLRSSKRRLGVDHPFGFAKRSQLTAKGLSVL